MTKYRNRKTTVDGVEYDSAKEARRAVELMLLVRAGVIDDLQRQVRFELIPKQMHGGKVLWLYIAGQVFNILLTLFAVWFLLSGAVFPIPVLD